MTITKLDNRLFKNIGSDKADPKNNLSLAVNSITTDGMPLSGNIRFTPSQEDCLKVVDKAVTAHCDTGIGKTDIGLFPIPRIDDVFHLEKGFGADPECRVVNYFHDLDDLHKAGRKITELPWGYNEKRSEFMDAAAAMNRGGFGGELLGALKWFLGAVLAAALCLLSYLVVDGRLEELLGSLSNGGLLIGLLLGFADLALRFGGWFVMVIAGLGAVAMLGISLFTVIAGLANSGKKESRRRLAYAYADVMRFIRVRILWFQNVYDTESVPMFLWEAENEILTRAQSLQKPLKRQLGPDWLASPRKYRITKFKVHEESKIIPHEIHPNVKMLMESDRFSPRFTEVEAANYLAVAAQRLGRVYEAITYFSIAADAGSAHGAWAAAQLYLAELKPKWERAQLLAEAEKGLGYPMTSAMPDLEEAERLARRAKELGHPMADALLEEIWLKQAHIYDMQAEDALDAYTWKLGKEGKGFEELHFLRWQDEQVRALYAKAGRAHRALADTGHSWSIYWIAVYLCQSAATVKEAAEACHWIYLLSASGHDQAHWVQTWYSQALNSLAIKLNKEGRGDDAGEIFLALAAAGVGQGMFNLAIHYSYRRDKIDDAIHWARKAQEMGEPHAEELVKKLECQKILMGSAKRR